MLNDQERINNLEKEVERLKVALSELYEVLMMAGFFEDEEEVLVDEEQVAYWEATEAIDAILPRLG
jgi:hypothetical protein